MRIKLIGGKQKELILKAKENNNLSWIQLAKELNLNECYIRNELKNEIRTLPKKKYQKLCLLIKSQYDEFIVDVLDDNWGQIKGGKNSGGGKQRKIKLLVKKTSEELAEMIGILLGDGNSYRKNGSHAIRICGHSIDDRDYLLDFVKKLFNNLFEIELKAYYMKNKKELMLYCYNKNVLYTLEYYGFPPGNKVENNVKIPNWIIENSTYSKACIRGIIDTDGSVYAKTKYPQVAQLEVKSSIGALRKSLTLAFKKEGFRISKWTKGGNSFRCGLYAKDEIIKYLKNVGFNNPKHKKRLEKIINAPVV